MKKLVYILLIITNPIFSQNTGSNHLFEYPDTNSLVLNVYANGNYGSSMFNNEFIDIFRFGGFIDNKMKDVALSNSKRVNYVGGEGSFGVSFSNPVYKLFGDWGYYIDISSNTSGAVQFTDDLYELAFYGNKSNAGDTSFIGQTGFHSRNFNKFVAGIDNNKLKIGLSFLSFSNYNQGLVQSGSAFTDSLGSNISLDINGSQIRSNNVLKHVGSGFALDFEYRLSQELMAKDSSHSKETSIIIGIKNIGIYVSRKNSVLTAVDTTYNYSGFDVSSISSFGNSIINQQDLTDSVRPLSDTTQFIGLLPFEIYFYKPAAYMKKCEVIYGFRYKIQSSYRAFLYFGSNLQLTKKMNISSYLAYGGYSKLQLGLALNKRFKNNLLVEINSNNLLGIFSKQQYGKAAGISLKYNFR